MQWRLKYPRGETYNKEDISALVYKRINHFYETLCDHQKVSKFTKKHGEINSQFVYKYKLADHESKTWLVNDWEDIGIADPFPDEDSTNNISFSMPENCEIFVYD